MPQIGVGEPYIKNVKNNVLHVNVIGIIINRRRSFSSKKYIKKTKTKKVCVKT